jgi:hypothetical protein
MSGDADMNFHSKSSSNALVRGLVAPVPRRPQ